MVFGLTSDETKIKVEAEKDCLQKISVEIPNSKVKEQIEKGFENLRSRAKAPGFRAGKMPLELIRETYKDRVYADAQEELLQQGVLEALKSKKINPVNTPVVQTVSFSPDKPFQFEFEVEVAPTFKLSGYKGIKLTKKTAKITDEEVQKTLANIANANAQLVESKEPQVKADHFALIDYEGFMDEKPIQGAKANNFLVDMAAPQTISGLAEGLLGLKVGEEKDISVEFPSDSPVKELAGKKAVFKVKLNGIKEKKTPALDDDFAKDLGLESLEQFKTRVKQNLEKEAEQNTQKDLEKQIVDHMLEENKFPLPPSLVEKQISYLLNRQRSYLAQQEYSKEELDQAIDRLKPEAKLQAEKDVRLAYVLNAVAEAEKIDVTDEAIMSKINSIVDKASPKEKAGLEKALKENYRDRLRSEIRDSQIFAWIVSNAKIKEVSGGQ